MSSCSIVMAEMPLLQFKLLSIALLSRGFLASFFISLGGAPKIDLPLSMFSLAKTVWTSAFLDSTLLA